jgi:hypothetical protein
MPGGVMRVPPSKETACESVGRGVGVRLKRVKEKNLLLVCRTALGLKSRQRQFLSVTFLFPTDFLTELLIIAVYVWPKRCA